VIDDAIEASESLAEGRLRTGVAGGGALRWAAADITDVVETARGRLDLSPVAAAALGRTLAAAALLLRLAVKTPARLVVEIAGDGPLGRVIAEADDEGSLRGMVGDPRASVPDRPDTKLAVSEAVGRGRMQVLRERDGASYASQVELVSGEIAEDVAHYLRQSEQSRPAVLLGVLGRPGGVAAAGGIIVEALPSAADEVLARLESNAGGAGGVSRLIEAGGARSVLGAVLAGLEPRELEVRTLGYRCRCSRERLERHLAPLPYEELVALADDTGMIDAECRFCAERYRFSPGELREPS
jgi:molecular chaperone Hsp33